MKNKQLWISFLMIANLGLIASHVYSQSLPFESAQAMFGAQRLLEYPDFAFEPSDKGKAELDALVKLIQTKPQMVQRTFIVIQVFTCEKELKVKPYLGVVRAKRIVDDLSTRCNMPRKKFLIQDRGANPLDRDCLAGSGLTLFLKPDWREGRD
ncbi:MAG: hypothetical protein MRZ79_20125 [Bacteroidia bacterium]|nr:hypothetical protein [Bacteroidia bacterium]